MGTHRPTITFPKASGGKSGISVRAWRKGKDQQTRRSVGLSLLMTYPAALTAKPIRGQSWTIPSGGGPACRLPVPVSRPVSMIQPHALASFHSGVTRRWSRTSGASGQERHAFNRWDISGVTSTHDMLSGLRRT